MRSNIYMDLFQLQRSPQSSKDKWSIATRTSRRRRLRLALRQRRGWCWGCLREIFCKTVEIWWVRWGGSEVELVENINDNFRISWQKVWSSKWRSRSNEMIFDVTRDCAMVMKRNRRAWWSAMGSNFVFGLLFNVWKMGGGGGGGWESVFFAGWDERKGGGSWIVAIFSSGSSMGVPGMSEWLVVVVVGRLLMECERFMNDSTTLESRNRSTHRSLIDLEMRYNHAPPSRTPANRRWFKVMDDSLWLT